MCNCNPQTWRWIDLASFVVAAVINALAAQGLLGGKPTGDISDDNHIYITPAGWTFSIWGVIYFFQAAVLVYGPCCCGLQSVATEASIFGPAGYAWIYVVSSVLNALWLVIFGLDTEAGMWIALVIILSLWVTLFTLYYRTRFLVRLSFTPESGQQPFDYLSVALLWPAWSLYTGWVTVASVLNIGIASAKSGWSASEEWSVVVAVLLALIFIVVGHMMNDPLYTLVGAWACAGVASESGSEKFDFQTTYKAFLTTSIILGVISVLRLVSGFVLGGCTLDKFFPALPADQVSATANGQGGYTTTGTSSNVKV